jgi:hypothetical protein
MIIKKIIKYLIVTVIGLIMLGCVKQDLYITIKSTTVDPVSLSVSDDKPINVKVSDQKPINVNQDVNKDTFKNNDVPIMDEIPEVPIFSKEDLKNHELVERTLIQHIKELRQLILKYNEKIKTRNN